MAVPEELKISLPETTWVFISSGAGESRHLMDVAWGAESLRSRGVPKENIFIFQDDANFSKHLDGFELSDRVQDLSRFLTEDISSAKSQVCFFVFAGHGCHLGIGGGNTIFTPAEIFKRARSIRDARRCVLIMGQCFGGIFEALDATTEKPEIGLISAAELNVSLSHSLPLDKADLIFRNRKGEVLQRWSANVFLFHFFSWIRQPEDIDGDGKCTLLDAYKYAGSFTNQDLEQIRIFQSVVVDDELEAAKKKLREHANGVIALNDLELQAANDTVQELSVGMYTYSDPWILHAHLIRATELAFK